MADTAPDDAPPTASRDADTTRHEAPGDESSVSAAVVTINKPAQELYAFWRDFANLPKVMENVEAITVSGDRSSWTVKAPAGRTVQWDAQVIEDQPGKAIGWQSVEGADIKNSGRIEFQDVPGRGAIVRAVIAYDPPGGVVGQLVAKLFQREPAIQARRDLRRFKQYMEAGEVATSSRTNAHNEAHRAG